MDMPLLILVGIVVLVALVLVAKTLYTVRTATAGVVERFGKFNRIVQPGLHVLVPFGESVYYVDLQVKQAQFQVETKTNDNVFVQIPVSVQYQILGGLRGSMNAGGVGVGLPVVNPAAPVVAKS
jgi:regulator of protease activity HflC (stomatin/prohibitin superfamily)